MAGELERVRRAVGVGVQAGSNVMLWGLPGTGKTAGVVAVGEGLGFHHEVVIGSIRDATDIGGLPLRTDHGVVLAPPGWAVRIVEQADAGRRSLLFLDELTTAPPAVQAAMLRVVLDRVAGELALPDGTAIVAAANPPEVAADGYDLAAPLANRFCHLDWPVDAQAWCEGVRNGWGHTPLTRLPDGWEAEIGTWRERVAGFIRCRPSLLHSMPSDHTHRGRAWPSPRSWDTAIRLMAAAGVADPDGTTGMDLLMGCVGQGAALEFMAWLDTADLPDPEDLLADPMGLALPQRGDRVHAVLDAVIAAVASRPSETRWNAAWTLLRLAVEGGCADVAAAAGAKLLDLRRDEWQLPADISVFAPLVQLMEPAR